MKERSNPDTAGFHLRFGWWTLLVFLILGLALDVLHGFKVPWYVNVDVQVRRMMWTLAHTHGTLVALVNIAFGLTLRSVSSVSIRIGRASICLVGASILMPAGFFLGGVTLHGGDPGLGALLVPPGALLLIAGVALVARSLSPRAQ